MQNNLNMMAGVTDNCDEKFHRAFLMEKITLSWDVLHVKTIPARLFKKFAQNTRALPTWNSMGFVEDKK